MNRTATTRSILALAALVAVLAAAGCGGSSDSGTNTTGSGSESQADLASVCAAKSELAASVKKLNAIAAEVKQPTDINDLTTQLDTVRQNFEKVNAEYKKLPAGEKAPWQKAESDFRLGFADAGLDLVDAVRASDPGASSQKAMDKLTASYESDYSGVDCPEGPARRTWASSAAPSSSRPAAKSLSTCRRCSPRSTMTSCSARWPNSLRS